VFEHVIPTRLRVSRLCASERASSHVGTLCSVTVTVKPGPPTFIDLGGTGRPVVGRFKVPAGIRADALFTYYGQSLTSLTAEPTSASDAGAAERETSSGSEWFFDTNVRPDGRFRIDDVPAGKYRLHAEVHEPSHNVLTVYGPALASVDTEIIVPEIPGGRSDVSLDVGTIELETRKPRGSD
jgi:hypothetical protein